MMKLKPGNPAGNRRRVISDLTSFRWERFLYHHVYCSSGNAILTSRRRHCELKGSLRRIDLAGHAPLPGSGQLHAGALHTARMNLRTCTGQCESSLTASRSLCLNPKLHPRARTAGVCRACGGSRRGHSPRIFAARALRTFSCAIRCVSGRVRGAF
jgi:hypothetical protein